MDFIVMKSQASFQSTVGVSRERKRKIVAMRVKTVKFRELKIGETVGV